MATTTAPRPDELRSWFAEERIRRDNERKAVEGIEQDREECKDLRVFIRRAWHVVEPANPYVHGWHIDAKSEHLMAVSNGQIIRLQINEPPGCMKSLVTAVFFPAYEWGPLLRPHLRYLTSSFALPNVTRDNLRMRRLVESAWFQARWPMRLMDDQNEKLKFENNFTGVREGRPFGSLTGGRGNRVIIDDPHSTEGAESAADRATAERIFTESVPMRVNDPITDAIIAIMQRLHGRDVCGLIEALGLDYVKLILPMEFERARRCVTSIGWKDPRTKEGELLFPARYPAEVVARDKLSLRAYGAAGQLQQRPAPRGGGIFQRAWFPVVKTMPAVKVWVRGWDFAASEEQEATGAETAGCKMALGDDGNFYIANVCGGYLSPGGVDRLIRATASQDGHGCIIDIPQDPGAAGKTAVRFQVSRLAGYVVHFSPESGSKIQRAEAVAAQAEVGNVYLLEGPWNESFLQQVEEFPRIPLKDKVDAMSRAFARLVIEGKREGGDDVAAPEALEVA